MKISQNLSVALVAVLLAFAERSQGSISTELGETAYAEKILSSSKFQNDQEAIIMTATDEDSLAAKGAIESIRKLVQQFPVSVVSPMAVNTAIDGVLSAVRLIYTTVRQANKAIDIASNLMTLQDTEGAIDAITNGLRTDRDLVYIAGVPIHCAQGSALFLAGGLAQPGLKKTSFSIQKAGKAVFEAIDIADEIAREGIKAGGKAATEALKAARDSISTGSLSLYKHLNDAAKYSLEGLQYAASKAIYEVDTVAGVIDSLQTKISTDEPAVLNVIARLDKGLKLSLSVLTKKSAIDATNVMYHGLRSTIIETADGISVARKAFEKAGQLASQDPDAAVAIVHKGVKEAQDEILNGSALGLLALGAAGKIAGEKAAEELVPAVLEIEYGKVIAYRELGLAERIAIVGIQGGELATRNGIDSVIQLCNAAAIALTQEFVDAAEIAFEVFQKN